MEDAVATLAIGLADLPATRNDAEERHVLPILIQRECDRVCMFGAQVEHLAQTLAEEAPQKHACSKRWAAADEAPKSSGS